MNHLFITINRIPMNVGAADIWFFRVVFSFDTLGLPREKYMHGLILSLKEQQDGFCNMQSSIDRECNKIVSVICIAA